MSIGEWLVLMLTAVVGITGLFLAASEGGHTTYVIGLALFAAAITYAFRLVKRHFDRVDQMRH